ncbi:MAG: glycosyltransferase [Planctomycetes bacterium]|nr:glycosyltransferase [Planctomycetota bacterium]
MSPAVSVVIATHNYGRYLAGAVRSVLAQTFTDFELVIVDDGSSDDTPEVAQPFLRDPRIRYHRTDRQGQPKAKNTGIRLTTAPLIAFLDADDVWLPDKLDRQVARFAADPELGVVYADRLLMDAEGHELECDKRLLYRGNVLPEMFQENFICFSSVMVRRAVFEEVGLFDETIPMAIDYDLWLRVGLRYRFDYVDASLVKYRTGHANLSRREEERQLIVVGIMRRFLDERGGGGVLDRRVVRRAWAETYNNMALERRLRSRLAALPWLLRSLAAMPWRWATWKGLLSLPLPEAARRLLRRCFAILPSGPCASASLR